MLKTLKPSYIISAAIVMSGPHAWAKSESSPVQKYKSAVECAALYDFSLNMVPSNHPQYSKINGLYTDWKAYAAIAKPSSAARLDSDISVKSKEIKTLATSGDNQRIQAYMTPLQTQCASVPVEEKVPSGPTVENPFGFTPVSDTKTYMGAVICAGVYATQESGEKPIFNKFVSVAKQSKPQLSQKTLDTDIVKATRDHINVLSGSKLEEFAKVSALCDGALPYLK